ncbi:hypothetical protein [Pantanalinema sp. GBBB05]|uniref:hypothetical protein n=1 Tax=Pantanalinema sp. GBBB05 TaxID=2604139 RepID=UPI001D612C99|nr:hypothetical protein [Pantanalinema sp. GBBB05]
MTRSFRMDGLPDLILIVLLFGIGLGIVTAFVAGFLTYQAGQIKDAQTANLILFFTLGGWFLGLLAAFVVLMVRNQYSAHAQMSVESTLVQLINIADWIILLLPSLGAIVGAIAYWQLFRVRRR